MYSIQRYLILCLLALMAAFYAVSAYWNYLSYKAELTNILADQLAHSAYTLQLEYAHHGTNPSQTDFAYQVWDTSGELLAASPDAPPFPLSTFVPGGSQHSFGDTRWNTFTRIDDINGTVFIAAQTQGSRLDFSHYISVKSFIPFLILLPFLGISIAWVIMRAFKPIELITQELNTRHYENLTPLPYTHAPKEIIPLTDSINALFERLNHAYERETRFAGDAAHELRTPLAAIRTMAQLAMNSKDIQATRELLEDVIKGVDRCTHVVRQLAVLNSLRPEEIMHEVQSFNLFQVTQQIVQELKPMADNKDITIAVEMTPDIHIQANLASIQILLRNLIDNALRYSETGTQVTVAAQETSENLTLIIMDQGPGIPEELRKRVFERFYRQLGTNQSGSGLGLSIVATICQLHQATISMENNPNGAGLQVMVKFRTTSRTLPRSPHY